MAAQLMNPDGGERCEVYLCNRPAYALCLRGMVRCEEHHKAHIAQAKHDCTPR